MSSPAFETRSIEMSLETRVDAEAAFRALTEERELVRWWTSTAQSDPKTGGRFRYAWITPGAPEKDHVQQGEYLDVVPGRLVRYAWATPEGPTHVLLTVARASGGARVQLVHSGWRKGGSDALFAAHVEGWTAFLGNLRRVLEGGKDVRADEMGLQTTA